MSRPTQEGGGKQARQSTVQLRDKDIIIIIIPIAIKRGIICPARGRKVIRFSIPRHIYISACVEGERITPIITNPTQVRKCQQGVDDEVFCLIVSGYLKTVFQLRICFIFCILHSTIRNHIFTFHSRPLAIYLLICYWFGKFHIPKLRFNLKLPFFVYRNGLCTAEMYLDLVRI